MRNYARAREFIPKDRLICPFALLRRTTTVTCEAQRLPREFKPVFVVDFDRENDKSSKVDSVSPMRVIIVKNVVVTLLFAYLRITGLWLSP
jgi:hypothetical protein